jgi:hypothetical protein
LSEQLFAEAGRGQLISPVASVEVFLPEPHDNAGREFWRLAANEFFGFRPVVLAGTVSLQANRRDRLEWRPSDAVRRWLE